MPSEILELLQDSLVEWPCMNLQFPASLNMLAYFVHREFSSVNGDEIW